MNAVTSVYIPTILLEARRDPAGTEIRWRRLIKHELISLSRCKPHVFFFSKMLIPQEINSTKEIWKSQNPLDHVGPKETATKYLALRNLLLQPNGETQIHDERPDPAAGRFRFFYLSFSCEVTVNKRQVVKKGIKSKSLRNLLRWTFPICFSRCLLLEVRVHLQLKSILLNPQALF